MSDEEEGVKKKKKKDGAPDETPVAGKRYYRRREDIKEVEESSHVWLISFTDVMALMLTFFVLLFSMTEPAKKEWSEIMTAMQTEFNKFYGSVGNRGPQDAVKIDKINFNRALNIGYLAALMDTVTKDSKYLENVTIIPQQGSLIISLPRDLLFDPGQAEVKEEGSRALYALGGSLGRIKNKVEVIGHADPRPTGENSAYDSNWDLSMMRAMNVAAILESVGYQNDIVVRGHSSGRYDDLQNVVDDEEKRLDLSRRVDIKVLDHDGSRGQVFFDRD